MDENPRGKWRVFSACALILFSIQPYIWPNEVDSFFYKPVPLRFFSAAFLCLLGTVVWLYKKELKKIWWVVPATVIFFKPVWFSLVTQLIWRFNGFAP
jgi:hypothetical protein